MVNLVIRRIPRTQILRDMKLTRNETSKTGIHSNPIVNEAIDAIEANELGSGTGLSSTASTTVPLLLKKRRELREQGKGK